MAFPSGDHSRLQESQPSAEARTLVSPPPEDMTNRSPPMEKAISLPLGDQVGINLRMPSVEYSLVAVLPEEGITKSDVVSPVCCAYAILEPSGDSSIFGL